MALLLTLDASIFIAACHRHEPGHRDSVALLNALHATGTPLLEPALLPVEVAAALGRTGTKPDQAVAFAHSLMQLPRLTLVALDEGLSRHAAELAARHRLRGADAVYVSVALLYGARLVTLDHEQERRAPAGWGVLKPAAATTLITA